VKEEALLLGPYQSLIGIYTPAVGHAAEISSNPAVILLNAGLVHHVGPHRLHVKLARALAVRGISTLRVDLAGIGDSSHRPDSMPAQQAAALEPREIMDDLVRRGHDSFVLFGICSGATRSLQAAKDDARVTALILVNQEVTMNDQDSGTQITAQFYLQHSLWNLRSWRNLLTGKINYRNLLVTLVSMVRRKITGGGHTKMALTDIVCDDIRPVLIQGTQVLMLLSDRHAQLLQLQGEGLQDLERSGQVRVAVHPEADHLFTSLQDQNALIEQVCEWTASLPQSIAGNSSAESWQTRPASR
jgi:hypothetical protein